MSNGLTKKQQAIFSRPTTKTQPTLTVSQALAKKRVNISLKDNEPKAPESLFGKASKFFEKGLKPTSKFLFGSLGKTAGKTILGGAEAVSELVTGKTIEEQGKKRLGFDVAGRGEEPAPSVLDIGFTVLETLPGGGALKNLLKKLPGSKQIIAKLDDALKLLPDKQKEKAIKVFTEGLAPTTKKTKAQAERIVPELLERGEAGTLKGLKEKAVEGTLKSGEQIDVLLKDIGKNKVETKPILEGINKFKERFIVDGKVIEPLAIKTADDIEQVVLNLGKEVDVDSLVKLRRIWDKQIAKKGAGFGLDDLTTFSNDIKKEATASIRSVLAKESPDLTKLNKEFNFWRGVDDVIGATLERTAGQSGKLRNRIAQGFGSVAGGATGGIPGVFIGAEIGKRLAQAFNSTVWKTKSSVWRNNFADKLIEGNIEAITLLLKELGVGIQNIPKLIEE